MNGQTLLNIKEQAMKELNEPLNSARENLYRNHRRSRNYLKDAQILLNSLSQEEQEELNIDLSQYIQELGEIQAKLNEKVSNFLSEGELEISIPVAEEPEVTIPDLDIPVAEEPEVTIPDLSISSAEISSNSNFESDISGSDLYDLDQIEAGLNDIADRFSKGLDPTFSNVNFSSIPSSMSDEKIEIPYLDIPVGESQVLPSDIKEENNNISQIDSKKNISEQLANDSELNEAIMKHYDHCVTWKEKNIESLSGKDLDDFYKQIRESQEDVEKLKEKLNQSKERATAEKLQLNMNNQDQLTDDDLLFILESSTHRIESKLDSLCCDEDGYINIVKFADYLRKSDQSEKLNVLSNKLPKEVDSFIVIIDELMERKKVVIEQKKRAAKRKLLKLALGALTTLSIGAGGKAILQNYSVNTNPSEVETNVDVPDDFVDKTISNSISQENMNDLIDKDVIENEQGEIVSDLDQVISGEKDFEKSNDKQDDGIDYDNFVLGETAVTGIEGANIYSTRGDMLAGTNEKKGVLNNTEKVANSAVFVVDGQEQTVTSPEEFKEYINEGIKPEGFFMTNENSYDENGLFNGQYEGWYQSDSLQDLENSSTKSR